MKSLLTILAFIFITNINLVSAQDDESHLLGIQADLGVPDGAALGLVLSPFWYPIKIVSAITTNTFQVGWRIGVTFDPIDFPVGLSLTGEYGSYSSFGISNIVDDAPQLNYSYINLHTGIEFGDPHTFRFFLRTGPSWLFISTEDLQKTIEKVGEVENITITKISEANVTLFFMPTIKLGITYMFL